MPRDCSVYLRDLLDAAQEVQRYVGGLRKQALHEEKTMDAVVRNLEIIGEAAKQVPNPVRQRHPEAPWARLAGLRDIVIHQHLGIDREIV